MSIVSGPVGSIMSANAQDRATAAQGKAAAEATAAELAMYNQSRKDFTPYRDAGARGMATLENGLFGGSGSYVDEHGITQTAEYKPSETAGFKYTKARTLDDLGRSLRMMGRGSGTVAANATGRTLGDLNANNEALYKNDMLNLVKIGQGAAGSTSALGQNTANSLSNIYQNRGNNEAQGAMNRASLWAGIGQQTTNAAANGYNAYKIGNQLGWWGNGGGAASAANAANAAEFAELA